MNYEKKMFRPGRAIDWGKIAEAAEAVGWGLALVGMLAVAVLG